MEEKGEWVGESFNPDIFDIDEVNQRLNSNELPMSPQNSLFEG